MNGLLLFLAGSNLGMAGLQYVQTGEITSAFFSGMFGLLIALICEEIEGSAKMRVIADILIMLGGVLICLGLCRLR